MVPAVADSVYQAMVTLGQNKFAFSEVPQATGQRRRCPSGLEPFGLSNSPRPFHFAQTVRPVHGAEESLHNRLATVGAEDSILTDDGGAVLAPALLRDRSEWGFDLLGHASARQKHGRF